MCARWCTGASISITSASSASTPTGQLAGEFRIVGLFTSTAYTRPARSIPYLRRKLAAVEQRAGFDPNSHSGKALANVIEQYPRDELFQIDEETLYNFALSILQLEEHPRVRVLARRDRFDRFVSVLVFVPRERYDSEIRAADRRLSRQDFRGPRLSASIRFSRKARWCASTSSSAAAAAQTPDVDRADAGKGRRRDRSHLGAIRSPTRSARVSTARQGRRCWRDIATHSPTAIARPIRRRPRSTISR